MNKEKPKKIKARGRELPRWFYANVNSLLKFPRIKIKHSLFFSPFVSNTKLMSTRKGENIKVLFNVNLHNVWRKQNSGSNKKNVCVRKFLSARFLLYFQFLKAELRRKHVLPRANNS